MLFKHIREGNCHLKNSKCVVCFQFWDKNVQNIGINKLIVKYNRKNGDQETIDLDADEGYLTCLFFWYESWILLFWMISWPIASICCWCSLSFSEFILKSPSAPSSRSYFSTNSAHSASLSSHNLLVSLISWFRIST